MKLTKTNIGLGGITAIAVTGFLLLVLVIVLGFIVIRR